MTSSLTLNVEKDELLARADELEAPLPDLPAEEPLSPCALALARTAASQVALSAANMRLYLEVGQREWQRLAQSLRNAAKAYEEVDEDAAEAIDGGDGSVSPVTGGNVETAGESVPLSDTRLADAGDSGYFKDAKLAAWEIEFGDQGASFGKFADEWTAFQRTLLEAAYRFRPFRHWDGDATVAIETGFDLQRSWLYDMADLCGTMARQVQSVTSAHRWAVPEHPPLDALAEQEGYWLQVQAWPPAYRETQQGLIKALLERFATYQAKSEEVLAEYGKKAAVPPVNPPKPPAAIRIPEPTPPPPDRGPTPDPGPVPDPQPEPDWSLDQLPGGLGSGGIPTGGMPIGADPAALKDVLADALNKPAGSGLKPASLGGGVGAGLPSGPLKPPYFPEPSPSSAANSAAGLGRPGAGGALGGGGMGMAPMGPGARPQGENNKGKRTEETEESLYTEQRPWTEGVIGIHKKVDSIRADSLRADALEADLLGLMR